MSPTPTCSTDTRLHVLSHVPYFAGLESTTIAEINALMTARWYAEDDAVYQAGEPGSRLHVVAAGRVKLVRPSPSGTDVLVDVLTPGGSFGTLHTLGSDRYSDTAQSLSESCVLSLSNQDFRSLIQRFPAVALAVVDDLAARLDESHRTIRSLSAGTAEQRVAAALLGLLEKFERNAGPVAVRRLTITRTELAGMVGLTSETVSRVLGSFKRRALVDIGRGWVSVLDAESLADLGAE
ncbi:Crp/Fnr family transcriptional regulator [Paramicrobacterium humi]|nr:Crp/Fnr family transcriptional regulator [Microbacterium humi]